MAAASRSLTRADVARVRRVSKSIFRRRKALGLTQSDLDRACEFQERTLEWIERWIKADRGIAPRDPRITVALETLTELEARSRRGELVSPKASRARSFVAPRKANPDSAPSTRPAFRASATLKLCPDHGVWLQQSGCEARLAGKDPICCALRRGKGCRGVRHRKLVSKPVTVEYTPPRPGEMDQGPRRFKVS